MALDTRNKRASAVGFLQPYRGVRPNPSGSSTAAVAGRVQAAYGYAGIDPGVIVITPTTPYVVIRGSTPRVVRGSISPRTARGDVPERLVR